MPGGVAIGHLTRVGEAVERGDEELIDLYLDGTIDKAMLDQELGGSSTALGASTEDLAGPGRPQRIDEHHRGRGHRRHL